MIYGLLLVLHIGSAAIGLVTGVAALFAPKGGVSHRRYGRVFLGSMMIMASSAAVIAVGQKEIMNVVVGVLTFYLVVSAWLTVRTASARSRIPIAAMLLALADGTGSVLAGVQVQRGAWVMAEGAAPCYLFGGLALFAAALDLRVLVRGRVVGAQRIARHLWRMCAALLITATSFFLARAHLFPEFVRKTDLNLLPIFVILGAMIYGLVRVHFTKAYKRPATKRAEFSKALPPSFRPENAA